MSKAHIKSSLAILNSPISIDDDTVELFHYDISPNGIRGTTPVDDIYDDSLICWLQSGNANSDNTYIVDKSRYGNHGKVSSYIAGQGMSGQALRFDKTNNVMAGQILPDNGTIEVWYYPTSFYNYNTIWDNSIDPNVWICWIYAGGVLGTMISPSGPVLQSNLSTLGGINKWYHIVQTWTKAGNIQLYVNGVLYGDQPLTWANPGAFSLGGCTNTKGDGILESCCIFNRPLTASEVANRYNRSVYKLSPDGYYGGCVSLGETTARSLVNYPNPLEGMSEGTISCFAKKLPNHTSGGALISIDSTQELNNGLCIDVNTNNVRFFIYDNTGTPIVATASVAIDNEWHMYAMTFDGKSINGYIDGMKVATQAYSTAFNPRGFLRLAQRAAPGFSDRWGCFLVDELRIDKVARASDEILSWYAFNAPFSPTGNERVIL